MMCWWLSIFCKFCNFSFCDCTAGERQMTLLKSMLPKVYEAFDLVKIISYYLAVTQEGCGNFTIHWFLSVRKRNRKWPCRGCRTFSHWAVGTSVSSTDLFLLIDHKMQIIVLLSTCVLKECIMREVKYSELFAFTIYTEQVTDVTH